MKLFSEELFKLIEEEFTKIQIKHKKEKEELVKIVQALKSIVEIDIPKLNKTTDDTSNERCAHIGNVVLSMNEEFSYIRSLVC